MLECSHGLHTTQIVYYRETMEGETTVGEVVDVLNTEGIRTSVGD